MLWWILVKSLSRFRLGSSEARTRRRATRDERRAITRLKVAGGGERASRQLQYGVVADEDEDE